MPCHIYTITVFECSVETNDIIRMLGYLLIVMNGEIWGQFKSELNLWTIFQIIIQIGEIILLTVILCIYVFATRSY